jgi:hypothetical protein
MAMQDRDVQRLLNLARDNLPGTSDAGLKAVLFDVINEFFDCSNAWLEWLSVPIITGTQTYRIIPQKGGMIIRLVTAFDPNKIGLPAVLDELCPPNADMCLTWPQNTNFTASVLVVKNVYQTVQEDIPDAPSWLLPMYERYIQEGLLARMMMQPGKQYTNRQDAPAHARKFRDGMAMVKTAVMRSNLMGGQSWRFPSQYRTQSQRGGVSTPFPSPTGWGV